MAIANYLASSDYIDWQNPSVTAQAHLLADSASGEEDIARACYEFVRDEVHHTGDYQQGPVTCSASQVLLHRNGYCFAKSHLLAALLRANGIPAGLCYQRVLDDEESSRYCLHGLNAAYLKRHGWYRLDPRGNKTGVDAAFCPPAERLAFALSQPGETDLPEIWAAPLRIVTAVLERYTRFEEVADNLPDVELWNSQPSPR